MYASQEGYTEKCAACFGGIIHCTASHCKASCIHGNSPGCQTCVDKYCTPDFDTCSGLTPPSPAPPPAGDCSDRVDTNIWKSKGSAHFWSDLEYCKHISTDTDKATICIENLEGYSQPCAYCFGEDMIHCRHKQ